MTTVLVANTAYPHSVGELIRIDAKGSTITGKIGGTTVTSATDTSLVSGTRGGFRGYRDVVGDDFTADNLEVGTTAVSYSLQPTHRPAPFVPAGPPPPQFARRY